MLTPLEVHLAVNEHLTLGTYLSHLDEDGDGMVLLADAADMLVEVSLEWGHGINQKNRQLLSDVVKALTRLRNAMGRAHCENIHHSLMRISSLYYICSSKPSMVRQEYSRIMKGISDHSGSSSVRSLSRIDERSAFEASLTGLLPQLRPHEVDLLWSEQLERIQGRGVCTAVTHAVMGIPKLSRRLTYCRPFSALMLLGTLVNAVVLSIADPFCNLVHADGSVCYVGCTLSRSVKTGHICDNSRECGLGNLEFALLLLFSFEAVARLIALQMEYFASPWSCLDFIAVVLSWISVNQDGPSLTVVRLAKLLMVLRVATKWKRLKGICTGIVESIYALKSSLGILLLFFLVFAISGVGLFKGSLRQQCFYKTTNSSPPDWYLNISLSEFAGNWTTSIGHLSADASFTAAKQTLHRLGYGREQVGKLDLVTMTAVWSALYDDFKWKLAKPAECPYVTSPSCDDPEQDISEMERLCAEPMEDASGGGVSVSGRVCPVVDGVQSVCRGSLPIYETMNPNPRANGGWISFDNLICAFLTIFQCLTVEGWTDILYLYEDASGNGPARAYFILLLLFGSIFLMQIALAIVTSSYTAVETKENELAQQKQDEVEHSLRLLGKWLPMKRHLSVKTVKNVHSIRLPHSDKSVMNLTKKPNSSRMAAVIDLVHELHSRFLGSWVSPIVLFQLGTFVMHESHGVGVVVALPSQPRAAIVAKFFGHHDVTPAVAIASYYVPKAPSNLVAGTCPGSGPASVVRARRGSMQCHDLQSQECKMHAATAASDHGKEMGTLGISLAGLQRSASVRGCALLCGACLRPIFARHLRR
jgi:hypothetical protein